MFYITPKWSELLNLKVWYAAVTQSFFSLSTGFGALITYSSYNDFRHNSYRDALIISVADTLTSLLAGFVIFSILGNLAFELQVPVKDVLSSDPVSPPHHRRGLPAWHGARSQREAGARVGFLHQVFGPPKFGPKGSEGAEEGRGGAECRGQAAEDSLQFGSAAAAEGRVHRKSVPD